MELMPQNVDIYVKAAHTSMLLGNAAGALEILKKVEKQFYDNPALSKEMGLWSTSWAILRKPTRLQPFL